MFGRKPKAKLEAWKPFDYYVDALVAVGFSRETAVRMCETAEIPNPATLQERLNASLTASYIHPTADDERPYSEKVRERAEKRLARAKASKHAAGCTIGFPEVGATPADGHLQPRVHWLRHQPTTLRPLVCAILGIASLPNSTRKC